MMYGRAKFLAVLTLFGALVGCVFATRTAPPELVLDRSLPEARRLAAVKDAELDGPDGPRAIAGLHVLVWSDRHPLGLRVAAMDRLIGYDAEAFWASADRWLVSVDDDGMARAVGDRAVVSDRSEMMQAFLRRWTLSRDNDDPRSTVGYQLLTELAAPRELVDMLWTWMESDEASPDTARGVLAWTALCKLEAESVRRQRLGKMPQSSSLIRSLRSSKWVIDRLPTDAEGVRWLSVVQQDPIRWQAIRHRRSQLHPAADRHLELRHWPAILSLSEQQSAGHPATFRLDADRFGGEEQMYLRDVPVPEVKLLRATEAEPSLTWPDRVVMWCVAGAMHDPAVVAAWFAQADADRADTTTEHGGVLTWDEGGAVVARAFEPQRTEGDHKFFSPPALIDAMYTGLAHYHFHAQRYDNAEFAGPGRGDLAFTEAMRANTLTLTFVDRDRLNVDLALPGGGVIDLGCVARPTVQGSWD